MSSSDILLEYPSVRIVAVIEPDSLANLVTNLSDSNCANAQDAYLQCTNYALKQLSAVGVISYLDAGHAGWLGWTSNLQPAATLFAKVYSDAGSPPQVRGLATSKCYASDFYCILNVGTFFQMSPTTTRSAQRLRIPLPQGTLITMRYITLTCVFSG